MGQDLLEPVVLVSSTLLMDPHQIALGLGDLPSRTLSNHAAGLEHERRQGGVLREHGKSLDGLDG